MVQLYSNEFVSMLELADIRGVFLKKTYFDASPTENSESTPGWVYLCKEATEHQTGKKCRFQKLAGEAGGGGGVIDHIGGLVRGARDAPPGGSFNFMQFFFQNRVLPP